MKYDTIRVPDLEADPEAEPLAQPVPVPGEPMVKPKPLVPAWPPSLDIALVPAVARLPPTLPAERRHLAARHALVCRIQGEFEEMPGLILTVSQAARLFCLAPDVISRILERLAGAGVLRRRNDGLFALCTEVS